MTHTPGPWVADNGDSPYYGIFAEDTGEPIAYLVEPGNPTPRILPLDGRDNGAPNEDGGTDYTRYQEHIANARLFAVAPVLLAALQRIADGQVMSGEFTHLETVYAYQQIARNALTKATEQ